MGLNEVVRGVSARVEPMSLNDWVKSKNYGFSTAAEWADQPNRSMDRLFKDTTNISITLLIIRTKRRRQVDGKFS